jgi:hypothetical protein
MKVALSFIGTGKYLDYLPDWYNSIKDYFLPDTEKHIFVFTDGDIDNPPDDVTVMNLEHKEWPFVSLERFKTILSIKDMLIDYDWYIFMDADMLVVNSVFHEDIFGTAPLIGVHHPCHYLNMPPHDQYPGAFDTNPTSTACISDDDDVSVYYQACMWGGKVQDVLSMCEQLSKNVEIDLEKSIIAKWDDESHLNKYFCSNKSLVNTLPPSYAYPEVFASVCTFQPKIVHLSKNNSEYRS